MSVFFAMALFAASEGGTVVAVGAGGGILGYLALLGLKVLSKGKL